MSAGKCAQTNAQWKMHAFNCAPLNAQRRFRSQNLILSQVRFLQKERIYTVVFSLRLRYMKKHTFSTIPTKVEVGAASPILVRLASG